MALFVSIALHALVVLIVAGMPIEKPAPREEGAAIRVTLLAERAGGSMDSAEREAVPPAPTSPTVVPEPTPRARPVAKPPVPAPASRLPTAAPPSAAPVGTEVGSASDANEANAAKSGSAALPSGSGAARLYGEHDVDRVAGPVGGLRRPSYPARERMLGREGRVSLLVTVDPNGAVRSVEVTHSAGAAFDSAARRAVEATPFRPAERGGLAVASTVTVNVSFELD